MQKKYGIDIFDYEGHTQDIQKISNTRDTESSERKFSAYFKTIIFDMSCLEKYDSCLFVFAPCTRIPFYIEIINVKLEFGVKIKYLGKAYFIEVFVMRGCHNLNLQSFPI